MSAKVPSLSEARWINDPAEKADQLMSYYFVADSSQTHLYPGHVVSLPAQVQEFGHDAVSLRSKVRDDLDNFLRPYFEQVTVDTSTDFPVPGDENRINLTVTCQIVEGGVVYSLGRMISTLNSKIVQIVDINNNIGG